MTRTVNISLPKSMYEAARRVVTQRHYSSISELVRDALRKVIDEDPNEITENGFPRWFEDKVLEAAKEPIENDVVLETDQDIERHFNELHKKLEKKRKRKRNGENS